MLCTPRRLWNQAKMGTAVMVSSKNGLTPELQSCGITAIGC